MTEVDWLCGRYPSPPEGLRVKLEAGMLYSGQEATPDRLREAASVSLKKALDRSRDRAAAFQVLAADAWLTYACEAALEGDEPDAALERLVSL